MNDRCGSTEFIIIYFCEYYTKLLTILYLLNLPLLELDDSYNNKHLDNTWSCSEQTKDFYLNKLTLSIRFMEKNTCPFNILRKAVLS